MKWLLVAFLSIPAWAQFPDAPTPSAWHVLALEPPRRITFWSTAPNRSFRSTLRSPWFIVPQVVGAGLAVWDYKRSECKGNVPCHQFWSERGIPIIVVAALQIPLDAKVSRPVGLIPAGVLIGKSLFSLVTGRYQ